MSPKRTDRRGFIDRRRNVFLALFVGALLLAVFFPGRLLRTNGIAWLSPGPGLRLGSISQAVSEGPIVSTTGEFSVEVFLSPDDVPGRGNQEILSFSDDERPRLLLIGKFPGGLLLRGRSDNPKGEPRDDAYIGLQEVGLEPDERVRHLAVTVDGEGARLHVNGRRTRLRLPKTIARAGEPFGGQLILGSSNEGWGRWSGDLFRVAVHDRALTALELRSRVENSDSALEMRGGENRGDSSLISRFEFQEGTGRATQNAVAGGPALVFPERITRPARSDFLSFEGLRSSRRGRGTIDIPLNVLGFMPLGFLIAFKRSGRWVAFGFLCGAGLSFSVEVAQSFIPGRFSSGVDLLTNSAGTLLGGLVTRLRAFR